MGYTTVREHTRRGYAVRAHSRRTTDSATADVLARDLDRIYDDLGCENASARAVSSLCQEGREHTGWYPVWHIDGDRILAWVCTECAASRLLEDG